MNVWILVSLGIANAPLLLSHPLVVSYFEDMASCVEAANQAKLPTAGTLGRSLNNVGPVCVRSSETDRTPTVFAICRSLTPRANRLPFTK